MDFQSAMETFAEAWVAANTQTPLTEAAETQGLMLSGGRISEERPPEQPVQNTQPVAETHGGQTTTFFSARSIPVHCVVEQITAQGQSVDITQTDTGNYAIIPGNVLFSDLVRTALLKLGYSHPGAQAAKGAIQLKNWRPLAFEQITESPEATVGDILGELSSVATLRIRLYSRPKPQSANDMKEKLLQVLLSQSQNLLISSGCPIDQNVLSALTKGRLECDIPEETRKKFDQWYMQQVFQQCRQVALLQQHQQQQHLHQHQHPVVQQPHTAVAMIQQHPEPSSPPQELTGLRTAQPGAARTRIRTSFDPELELPKLHRWFADNQHPSRLQIQQYVRELNSLESRRGRKPLDVNNVVYWFKNARAAHKRAEQRSSAEPQQNGEHSRMMDIEQQAPSERFSGSESQEASDDSDNIHTLDLSVRSRCFLESPVIKDEPKDSASSLESSESGEEDMAIECVADSAEQSHHSAEERRKRNRTFIDPVSEVPRLEQWFSTNTHPSHGQIVRFTHDLNGMQYRQKFPKLEPKNIQFWFKNRRAKCKRLNLAATQNNGQGCSSSMLPTN
ncbi:hypothetical protein JTE90_016865 [Oedothorax gibbosus]|uniref:DNA-binding protein SATB1 n=1 Tax=Oedothorax gibbosus TaxID=931172 RepID=A0AAV6VXK4_9ARAC|nr:hypothetical protein JTE90_016865 [Oedothorax gibbosus]